MKCGFIGFGGAGYGLAKGLREAGVSELFFYDPLWQTEPQSRVIARRATETGALVKASLAALVAEVDLVVSCVTGSVALAVAREAAPFLTAGQLFVDVNTASPETMTEVAAVVADSGAAMVDVAMMGAVPAFLHRVPSLASGDGAVRFKATMEPFGMDITVVGELAGQASAIKMFRSIFMKGFLALLLEMLTATHRYQIDATVLGSLAKTMEKNTFFETVRLQLAKGVISAERMSHEMEAVVATLDEMGLPAVMAAATRDKLKWCSGLRLDEHFAGEMPDSLDEILDAILARCN